MLIDMEGNHEHLSTMTAWSVVLEWRPHTPEFVFWFQFVVVSISKYFVKHNLRMMSRDW
jgi:hypothetical protein